MLTLFLLDRANRVKLVLLGPLLVQLAVLRSELRSQWLLRVSLRLSVGRRLGGYVVGVCRLLLRVALIVRVVGMGLLMLRAGMRLLLGLRVVLREMVHV